MRDNATAAFICISVFSLYDVRNGDISRRNRQIYKKAEGGKKR